VKLKNQLKPLEATDDERAEYDKQAKAALDRLKERHKRLK